MRSLHKSIQIDIGERISHCVQMWWYYLQGLQADLWNSLPPKIASNMYAKIFDHTYGILVGRYAKVEFIIKILIFIIQNQFKLIFSMFV